MPQTYIMKHFKTLPEILKKKEEKNFVIQRNKFKEINN